MISSLRVAVALHGPSWGLSHLPPWIGSPVVPSRKHLAAAELPFNALANSQHLSNREIKTSWEHPMPASHLSPGLWVQSKCLAQFSCCSLLKLYSLIQLLLKIPGQYLKGRFPFAFLQTYFQQEVKPNPWEICCLGLCMIFFFLLNLFLFRSFLLSSEWYIDSFCVINPLRSQSWVAITQM